VNEEALALWEAVAPNKIKNKKKIIAWHWNHPFIYPLKPQNYFI